MDVDGVVKSRKLYQTVDGQDTRIYPVPIGAIMMWSGDKNDIPEGWFLCDGSERTDKYGTSKAVPDLRDKFIRGVGGSYAIGDGDGSHL